VGFARKKKLSGSRVKIDAQSPLSVQLRAQWGARMRAYAIAADLLKLGSRLKTLDNLRQSIKFHVLFTSFSLTALEIDGEFSIFMAPKSKAAKKTPTAKKGAHAKKGPAPKKAKVAASASKKASHKSSASSKKAAAPKNQDTEKSKEKNKEKVVAQSAAQKRRSQAHAAMREALEESSTESNEEEEFDPAAFFAASGGQGEFRAHVMRKERVDLSVPVRYRFVKGPLVYNAELINLSKGGLALKTTAVLKDKTVIRIEIPLPHTSELFAVQAEVVWSGEITGADGEKLIHTGLRFLQMSLAKQAVINQFIQQRRDEVIMAKIGLDKFTDSVPVAGLD
jgi:hypothetical protein